MPYYDDDGNELNPALVSKPALCTMCVNDDDPHEEILCNLTRFDHRVGEEFRCFSFESKWDGDGNVKPPRPPRPAPPWATSSESTVSRYAVGETEDENGNKRTGLSGNSFLHETVD